MVTPNSRRAFLFGRRTASTPWGQFCTRLSRTCEGALSWNDDPAHPQAWLRPARAPDVLHAHALCREYGVRLGLDGVGAAPRSAHPVLWVEPGSAWATLKPQDAAGTQWRADAGCTIGALQAAGIQAVAGVDPHWSVARWLASEQSARWLTGEGGHSGIEQVQVLLADGTTEVLGPFGASAQKPLASLTTQQMVPRLFELSGSASAAVCLRAAKWPARFRLDALMPVPGTEVNLAWLMAGHAGCLAWVESVWLNRIVAPASPASPDPGGSEDLQVMLSAADVIDWQVKQTFDPYGFFLPFLHSKGLESASPKPD